jgi:putative holliday junction resolvase
MPALILPLAEIAPHLPHRGVLVGLDLGTKTIGVAACDADRRLAVGIETISRAPSRRGRLRAISPE